MNNQRTGVNLLLIAEGLLLIAVLVVGIVSGAAGIIQKDTEDTEDKYVSQNTEHENWSGSELESENHSGTDTESESGTEDAWVIPENYVDNRVTFSESVEAKLAQMTTEQKVAQLFVVTPEALTGYDQVTVFGNASKLAFDKYPVGGLVYSTWNYQGDVQMQELINNAQIHYTTTFGMKLFTMTREGQINSVTASIEGTADSYYNMMFVEGESFVTPEECQEIVSAGADVIILDNAVASGVTGDETTPCCLSNRLVGLLRESMDYQGLLMTDVLADQNCVTAIQAGVDIIYMPADFASSYNAVLQAVQSGDISMDRLDNAVGRILTAKGV